MSLLFLLYCRRNFFFFFCTARRALVYARGSRFVSISLLVFIIITCLQYCTHHKPVLFLLFFYRLRTIFSQQDHTSKPGDIKRDSLWHKTIMQILWSVRRERCRTCSTSWTRQNPYQSFDVLPPTEQRHSTGEYSYWMFSETADVSVEADTGAHIRDAGLA